MGHMRDAFSTKCPECGESKMRVTAVRNDLRPRGQIGTLDTNQDHVSTTKEFECDECGHTWTEAVIAK